jgi:quinohemoprotein ethanol dehydrogenase
MIRSVTLALAASLSLLSLQGTARAAVVDGAAIASDRNDGEWLSYGRNYSEQRFSPLDQVSKETVNRLGLEWSLDLADARSLVGTPLAVDGTLYFTTSWAVVYAVDASTGKVRWVFDPHSAGELAKTPGKARIVWGTHRGVAFWKGKVYVGTTDGRLIALAADSGKPLWSVQTFDPASSRFISAAPRVFNNKVIIGHSGGDVGAMRGYVTAYDADTGQQVWRFYTVPGNPADGFEDAAMAMAAKTWSGEWWKFGGGGAVWNAITYDPQFNRIYLGTGNAEPWNGKIRNAGGGDNLFTAAIVALDADTGRYVWHYQLVPGDTWDYDAAPDIMLADLAIHGVTRKVLMQASKDGFFYVIDRSNGKLLSAAPFGHVTWAERIDLVTGRPVERAGVRYLKKGKLIWPGDPGAHTWHPMSYSPLTGLVYIPTMDGPEYYHDEDINPATWTPTPYGLSFGLTRKDADIPIHAATSALVAWDPVKQKEVWKAQLPSAWPSGTLATKGHLVFAGRADGKFVAYADDTGAKLWEFDAQRGIVAPPISYALNGKQYIAVLVDWAGGAVEAGGSMFSKPGWTYRGTGRRLLTFALGGQATLPPSENPPAVAIDVPEFKLDPAKEALGNRLYASSCSTCHGAAVLSGGGAPDLRASPIAANLEAFEAVLLNGALAQNGMARYSDLSASDVEALYSYIRARARETDHAVGH